MKTQANELKDGRDEIYSALYRALASKAKRHAANAWAVGVVSGPTDADRVWSLVHPMSDLRAAAKPGRFSDVMEACARLGDWWLRQPCNAKHLMRDDVTANVTACRAVK